MPLTKIKKDVIANLDASKLYGTFGANDGSLLTGLSTTDWDLRYNLALNFFNDSVKDNMDRLSLHQGWVDTFEDASDVTGEGFKVATTYTAQFVDDIYRKTGNLDGLTDGTNGIFFCRINFNGNDGIESLIVRNGFSRFKIFRNPSNQIAASMTGTSSVNILETASSTSYTSSSETITILMSWNSSNFTMYIDDVEEVNTSMSGANIDYTGGDWGIMGHPASDTAHVHADISQLYLDTTNTLDLSVAANRRLFTESADDNFPLDLSGVKSPILYFNSAHPNWGITNLGTGGNFFLAAGSGAGDGGSTPLPNTISDALYSSESFTNSYELIDSYGVSNSDNSDIITDSTRDWNGNTFTTPAGGMFLYQIGVPIFKLNTPTGNLKVRITGHDGTTFDGNIGTTSIPDNNIIATSNLVAAGTISSTSAPGQIVYFIFPEPVLLSGSTKYCWIIDNLDGSKNSTNRLQHGLDISSPTYNGNNFVTDDGGVTYTSRPYAIPFYLYGSKNLDLITKGSDDIGNSPAAAPEKGHMEVLMTEQPASVTTTWSDTLNANLGGQGSQSVRQVIPSSAISINGNSCRVTLEASSVEPVQFGNVSIVERVGTTPNGTTTPTEILFGGVSGVDIPTGGTVVSDWVDFEIDSTKDYLVTHDLTGVGAKDGVRRTLTGGGTTYFLAGNAYNIAVFNAQTTNTGHTSIINKLEVGVPQVLDTDIIGQISRDGGTAWTDIPLTRIKTQVGGTNNNLLVGNATLTSTSGTNIKGRIKTANKDKITVDGISVNWS